MWTELWRAVRAVACRPGSGLPTKRWGGPVRRLGRGYPQRVAPGAHARPPPPPRKRLGGDLLQRPLEGLDGEFLQRPGRLAQRPPRLPQRGGDSLPEELDGGDDQRGDRQRDEEALRA